MPPAAMMSYPVMPQIPIVPFIQQRSFLSTSDILWCEFTGFPQLPPELRLKVWAYSLPDPRVITIQSVPPRSKDYLVSCKNRVPSTLLANRESRDVALKRYSPRFLTFENVYGPPVYFDFDRDIICVKRCSNDWWTDFNDEFNKDLSLVKRVIIQNPPVRPPGEFIARTTPFYNIDSLGLVRHPADPAMKYTQQWRLFCDITLRILRGKETSRKPAGTEVGLLQPLQIYFLSCGDAMKLRLGEILWES